MGGRAIKSSRRFLRNEYFEAVGTLVPKVKELFNTDDVHVVQSLLLKDSFGDMDVLIKTTDEMSDIRQLIIDCFGNVEISRNSNVWSIDYNGLQVDLILTHKSNYETAKIFFSYNDLGNFVGKLVNNYGKLTSIRLRYGFDGLKFSVFEPNTRNNIGHVYLTKDMSKVFDFFQLSWDRFLEGFNTIEDVFAYVQTSPYFDSESFEYENLNHINKQRNKKRPNYYYFLEWMKTNNVKVKCDFPYDEDFYINKLFYFFSPDGSAKKEMERIIALHDLKKHVASLFNGSHVMEAFNLQGKDITSKMSEYKETFGGFDKYSEFVMCNDLDSILFDFKSKVL